MIDNKCEFSLVLFRTLVTLGEKLMLGQNYSCVVCKGNCSFGESYVGQSVRNVVPRSEIIYC